MVSDLVWWRPSTEPGPVLLFTVFTAHLPHLGSFTQFSATFSSFIYTKLKKDTRSDDVLEPGLPHEIQESLADVLVAAGEVRVAAGHPGEPPLDSILH